jgi:5-methylcytosine-specific restriction endonuclease McrA
LHHIDGAELVSKKITKHRFRRGIIAEWEGRCAYCDCQPEQITLDHVVPKVKGGTTQRLNLVPACAPCNVAKNHCDWADWYGKQPYRTAEREDRIRAWMEGK